MEFGLSAATLSMVRAILAANPKVEQAILYGSRAKGTHKPGSDIDLALVGANLDFSALASIADYFDESDLPYKVDIRSRHPSRSAACTAAFRRSTGDPPRERLSAQTWPRLSTAISRGHARAEEGFAAMSLPGGAARGAMRGPHPSPDLPRSPSFTNPSPR